MKEVKRYEIDNIVCVEIDKFDFLCTGTKDGTVFLNDQELVKEEEGILKLKILTKNKILVATTKPKLSIYQVEGNAKEI